MLSLLVLGCSGRAGLPLPAEVPEATPAAAPSGFVVDGNVTIEGLTSLACREGTCRAVVQGRVRHVDLQPLTLGPPGTEVGPDAQVVAADPWFVVEPLGEGGWGRVDYDPLTEALGTEPQALTPATAYPSETATLFEAWNHMIAQGFRSPFQTRIPSPQGGVISYLRGLQPLTAQLMRTGPSPKVAPGPGSVEAALYPAWLALHPTGTEAYVIVWPDGGLRAFDPDQLDERWRIPLFPGAQGLFVDAAGRYLLAEQSGTIEDGRYDDFAIESLQLGTNPEVDPTCDAELRLRDRPDAAETVVVDLAEHRVSLTVSGAFVAWIPVLERHFLLATEMGIWLVAPTTER